MQKRLYRSATDKQIAGVCAGLAEYFDVDVTLVRIAFVVAALVGGPGLLIYIALWFVMPEEDDVLTSVDFKNKNDDIEIN